MPRRMTIFALAIAALLLGQASGQEVLPPPSDSPEAPAETTVTMRFDAAPIRDVLDVLVARRGLNLIVGPEVQGLVTLNLVDVPWENALRAILETHGLASRLDGSILRVDLPEALASAAETRVFPLEHVPAEDVRELLQPLLTARGIVDVFRKGTGDERASRVLAVTDSRENLERLAGLVDALDRPGRPGLDVLNEETRVFELQHAAAPDVLPLVAQRLSPRGKVSAVTASSESFTFGDDVSRKREAQQAAHPVRSRKLVVTDRSDVLEAVAGLIAVVDRPVRQVNIQVRLVEVRTEASQQLGIQWNMRFSASAAGGPHTWPFRMSDGPDPLAAPFPTPSSDLFRFGLLDGSQFSALLQAVANDGRIRTLSAPNVTTLDNQEASILIGEKFPITIETIDPQTAVRTVTLDHFEDIGIQLLVVPQVFGDDHVRLKLHPAVSSLGSVIEGKFPQISTREADTQLNVPSGTTAVIGGMMEERELVHESRTPLLGSIPLLGRLFRWKSKEKVNVELMIFVTPTVVPASED